MSNTYCVIMAGGVGSRFWPKSTQKNPKQFLDVLGTGKTLIQQTFERFNSFIPSDKILVVTNDIYVDLVATQLPQISAKNILSEPFMRNTAPCLAYAIKKIEDEDPGAIMIVSPADHLISKTDVFEKVMDIGIHHVSNHNEILTIGIEPNRPNTGYGYIEYSKTDITEELTPVKVIEFKEKPSLELAEKYVKSGNYSWNSGIFLWSIKTILESFSKNASEILSHFETNDKVYNTSSEKEFINKVYQECPSISIDYAILEKAGNVSVINTDIGWSDIGTWVSLEEHITKSSDQNYVISGKTLTQKSTGNIVSLPAGKVLATKGLNNFIIVESDGVLMIVAKEFEQDIKQLREEAGKKFGNEIT